MAWVSGARPEWWLLGGVLLAACGSSRDGGTRNAAVVAAVTDTVRSTAATAQSAPPNQSPCNGQAVLVTFSAESVGDISPSDIARSLAQLRTLTARAIAPMRDRVIRVEYSPVIHTARLSLRDSASVRPVVGMLGRAADVSEVSLDACTLRVQGKPKY
jgi:hypothetical protein